MAAHKLGYITASIFDSFMTGAKADKLITGNMTACMDIALERLERDGYAEPDPDDTFDGNKHTERGNRLEPHGIAAAEAALGKQTHSHQKVFEHPVELWSCTVDALIDNDSILEHKAPTRKNQAKYIDNPGTLRKKYYDQVQYQLMLSGRSVGYIVSYCPLYHTGAKLYSEVIMVDKEWRDFALTRLAKCEEEIQRIYDELLNA